MSHSQSFVQAGTCFPLSAPWFQVITVAKTNTHDELQTHTIHTKCLCCPFPQLIRDTKDQFNNLICFIFQRLSEGALRAKAAARMLSQSQMH